MWDILTFHRFITRDVLLTCYYLGAVAMPAALFLFRRSFVRKFDFLQNLERSMQKWFKNRSLAEKTALWIVFVVIFLLMELGWRMLFEAMIGYFDIHDDLHRILMRNKGVR